MASPSWALWWCGSTPKLSSRARSRLPKSKFACPDIRKYPLTDKKHVRNAIARYAQSGTEKCFMGDERICEAAQKFGIKSPRCPK